MLIGHERYGAAGGRLLGIIPQALRLVFLSLFVKRLRLGRSGVPSREQAMAMLRELLEAGNITPVIDRTYPLADVRSALRHMIEGETYGKVVITT